MPDSLEQLDLLLTQEVRSAKCAVMAFTFRAAYLSLTLAAYVGEEMTIRFDPRDMGEIRVFYQDQFLCPAVSAELAGETTPLRDIIRVPINVGANLARSSRIGNEWSIRFCN
jgi:putative transposase